MQLTRIHCLIAAVVSASLVCVPASFGALFLWQFLWLPDTLVCAGIGAVWMAIGAVVSRGRFQSDGVVLLACGAIVGRMVLGWVPKLELRGRGDTPWDGGVEICGAIAAGSVVLWLAFDRRRGLAGRGAVALGACLGLWCCVYWLDCQRNWFGREVLAGDRLASMSALEDLGTVLWLEHGGQEWLSSHPIGSSMRVEIDPGSGATGFRIRGHLDAGQLQLLRDAESQNMRVRVARGIADGKLPSFCAWLPLPAPRIDAALHVDRP